MDTEMIFAVLICVICVYAFSSSSREIYSSISCVVCPDTARLTYVKPLISPMMLGYT